MTGPGYEVQVLLPTTCMMRDAGTTGTATVGALPASVSGCAITALKATPCPGLVPYQ